MSGSELLNLAATALPDDPEVTLRAYAEGICRYQGNTEEKVPRYEAVRRGAAECILAILKNCPPSADRTAAIRKVREAMMTANASIALE